MEKAVHNPFQGSLFAEAFLLDSITELEVWRAIDEADITALETDLKQILKDFPITGSPNESQTEDDLIWPVLKRLGWNDSLRQQGLSVHGREAVPDGLLFADTAAKAHANRVSQGWQRYEHGQAVVESKRWMRPLGRGSDGAGEATAPATQMLRYMRRIDDLTTGKLRWGILTNGAHWRLYYSGAQSVSEQFFEIDLAATLDAPGHNADLLALDAKDRRHWLKVFLLAFRREGFPASEHDDETFHQRAMMESRLHQARVAEDLSDLVFRQVFPNMAKALAAAAPNAPLPEVRDAALVLLYRLLFVLYAEDRNLLPVRDDRYDDYGLREKVRKDIGRRKDQGDAFSDTAARYWSALDDLCRAIDKGDASIGLPPYNGGLFDRDRTPLLASVRLGDAAMADALDALSFEQKPDGRRYINYRDLGVQQLGSIYERLLEQELVAEGEEVVVSPNRFSRKDSGSYYTPDDLVGLIVRETLQPLAKARMDNFKAEARKSAAEVSANQIRRLKALDPAEQLLNLKVCDPAMGSGHFLVTLVDHLADLVIAAMAHAEEMAITEANAGSYVSPLAKRIKDIRTRITANAETSGWTFDPTQLDDRCIVRRMVLKRCIYGVDKNPMAVELAKLSLWLHTFTVGAPLGFLDHHLRAGDSLFGAWVKPAIDRARREGGELLMMEPLKRAASAAAPMQEIEALTDAEIAEAERSAETFAAVTARTAPLNAFLSLLHAFEWMDLEGDDDRARLAWLTGIYGDPLDVADGSTAVPTDTEDARRLADLLERTSSLAAEQRFLNWQVAFPGVWSDWHADGLHGGFDAVIGNPPWDRMKLQQVEWFAARRPDIARAQRAADRKRMIAGLEQAQDPLAKDFALASERAATAARIARKSGDYPLLSKGDMNIYSLFVERAMTLTQPGGMVGLLVPSGIASDKTAAPFFKRIATEGRLRALYDFENKKVFFPDVHASFKFCAFIASASPGAEAAQCAFFLQDVAETRDPERCFPLRPSDFARVNPNTGTAPIFRSRRDAELTKGIYERLPVLVDRSGSDEIRTWPVKYMTMFHMTNDSGQFRARNELQAQEGAWPVGGNRWNSPTGEWLPLYEGKMVQAFDHRAASIVVNTRNLHRPAQPQPASIEQKQNPDWLPEPQYWVLRNQTLNPGARWLLGFKDVTAPTNVRSMIAAIVPPAGAGNTLPVLSMDVVQAEAAALLLANLNAIAFDFIARQKIQGQHLNWYIIEQLPVVPPERYDSVRFGPKTAGEIVREAVLELTYTAHDMAPFAVDLGYVDGAGKAWPPFPWDEARRLYLRAKLDALYFNLYGVRGQDDIRYIYSTFPIVQQMEMEIYDGQYRSLELCLAWQNALSAGEPDAQIQLPP